MSSIAFVAFDYCKQAYSEIDFWGGSRAATEF